MMYEHNNIFFTGERGIGKSYAVNKVIGVLGVDASGFKTKKVCVNSILSKVYVCDLTYKSKPNCVAEIVNEKPVCIRTNIFNKEGVRCLKEVKNIIVMDELGFLEKNADRFRKAVLTCLISDIPVLGVLHCDKRAPWVIKAVKDHAKVIKLDGKNNNAMIEFAIQYFNKYFHKAGSADLHIHIQT